MTPYEVLGVPPQASKAEIVAAYRTLVQIFHPDRFVDAPENVRREAERRMKALNEAYAAVRNGRPQYGGNSSTAPGRNSSTTRPSSPGFRSSSGGGARVPWDTSARARADQAVKAEQARRAREQAAPNGDAVGRPKSGRTEQSVLAGLGEALVTNRIPCHRCNSIQWLPSGWREALLTTDYYCSMCSALLLRR